jgi:CRP-like cAMP-binding protein
MKNPKRGTIIPFEINPMAPETQSNFEKVFNNLKVYLPHFPEGLTNDIISKCKLVKFKKNEIILDYGEICRYCYFAVKGLVLIKFLKDGIEKVKWALIENDVIVSVKSFNHQTPSMDKLIAREDTLCVALSWEDLQTLYDEYPAFLMVGHRLTQYYYEQAEERATWVHYSAEERYEMLLKQYPWANRVTDAELASYLGITNVHLSRIKNKGRGNK